MERSWKEWRGDGRSGEEMERVERVLREMENILHVSIYKLISEMLLITVIHLMCKYAMFCSA